MADHASRFIRVLLAELPPLLAELVGRAVAQQPDMELIGAWGRQEALTMVAEWSPDVVIVPAEASGIAEAYHIAMRRHPNLKVLGVDGRQADLYESRLLAANAGMDAMVAAIRAVTGR